MRARLLIACLLLATGGPAASQVSVGIGIGLPGVNIGINLGGYPELAPVPGYPVYYAPELDGNFFFYDGLYWVYAQEGWYASTWYNGPWDPVDANLVPYFVLRIPVQYYRRPPPYFRGWRPDGPPHWGDHWGRAWEQRHGGWDRWDHASAPRPAPLPVYQRQYSGDRYPQAEQQHDVRRQNYQYKPREAVTRQHFQEGAAQPGRQSRPHDQGQSKDQGKDQGKVNSQGHGQPERRTANPQSVPAQPRSGQANAQPVAKQHQTQPEHRNPPPQQGAGQGQHPQGQPPARQAPPGGHPSGDRPPQPQQKGRGPEGAQQGGEQRQDDRHPQDRQGRGGESGANPGHENQGHDKDR